MTGPCRTTASDVPDLLRRLRDELGDGPSMTGDDRRQDFLAWSAGFDPRALAHLLGAYRDNRGHYTSTATTEETV